MEGVGIGKSRMLVVGKGEGEGEGGYFCPDTEYRQRGVAVRVIS